MKIVRKVTACCAKKVLADCGDGVSSRGIPLRQLKHVGKALKRIKDVPFFFFVCWLLVSVVSAGQLEEILYNAVRENNISKVERAIYAGAEINAKDELGWTPLMSAAFHDYFDIARFLIEKGADVNAKTPQGFTALIIASGEKSLLVSRILTANGADVNAQTKTGLSSLMISISKKSYSLSSWLLEMGADPYLKDFAGKTAFEIAGEKGYDRMVSLLGKYSGGSYSVKKGISDGIYAREKSPSISAFPDIRSLGAGDNSEKLVKAVRNNSLDMVELLISRKADVNFKNKEGITPLMWAAFNNSPKITRLLIENGASVNAKTKTGVTALIFAAGTNSLQAAKILLRNGADVNAVTKHDVTAIMSADSSKFKEMITLLADSGAKYRWISSY